MKDGVNATPLTTVNATGYIDHAAFLGTITPDTNKIPKHLCQGYLNIYNNYFKAPWMRDCFFQAEDGIRDYKVTGVQTCALPIFFPTIADRRVLLIGAGDMIDLCPTHLAARRPKSMTVANRTLERGAQLASRVQADAI